MYCFNEFYVFINMYEVKRKLLFKENVFFLEKIGVLMIYWGYILEGLCYFCVMLFV